MLLNSPSLMVTLFFGCIVTASSVDSSHVNSNMPTINLSEEIMDLQDTETPVGAALSGKFSRSYAYTTIKDRLPVILTGVIDNMSRNKESIIKNYGDAASEELKLVIGNLSQLRSEIMTNKQLSMLNLSNSDRDADADIWNKRIDDKKNRDSSSLTWFMTDWIFCETYMYRRLSQIYVLTETLSHLDYFESQKQNAFTSALNSISNIINYLLSLLNNSRDQSEGEKRDHFIALLKLNLWGNRCDLSHSGGAAVDATRSCGLLETLPNLDNYLLIDDTLSLWHLLNRKGTNDNRIIDIVLDNSGYELITDLCLAAFLTHEKLATKIRFYVKRIPWFISDVTVNDFHWTIATMKNSTDSSIQEFGNLCENYLNNGTWSIELESFWTEPYVFSEMKEQSPDLYAKLSEAKLIIFKGDLNYRKLLGDINWDTTTDLVTALRGFTPSNLVTLRTMKADLCVGLPPGRANELSDKDENWMISGQYGVINASINAHEN